MSDLVGKVAFFLSVYASIVGCLLTYFWMQVVFIGESYARADFVVHQVHAVRTSSKGKRILAEGSVGARKEILFSWREYAGNRAASQIPAGETWTVIFNDTKGETLFGGRSLRVLSLQDFAQANRKLAGSILVAVSFPSFLVVRWLGKRKGR